MRTIKFSKPYDKICCNYFTTIRPHNPEKYREGEVYILEIPLSKEIVRKKVQATRVYTHKLSEIHEAIYITDINMSKEDAIKEIKRIYRQLDCDNSLFDLIVLEYYYDA